MLSTQQGFQSMLKDGYRHYQGLEEALSRNIEACKAITNITKTSYGPNCMKKLIVSHIDKIFVTNDASTILREINVHHPAANLIVMASKMQKEDYGDGTNYVVTLTGELLSQASLLIRTGVHPSAIVSGYELALKKTQEILQKSIHCEINVNDERIVQVIESVLAPKIPQFYKLFSKVIVDGCRAITKETYPRFNEDSFRVCKILGSNVEDSHVLKGFVINRGPEGHAKEIIENGVVACYRCPY